MEKNNLNAFEVELSDVEVEENVLGSIMTYGVALDEVRELLCPGCFSTRFNKEVYAAILSLSDKGDPIDIITVTTEMKRMGEEDPLLAYNVTRLSSKFSPHYYYNSLVLVEFLMRNKAWVLGQELILKARNMTYDLMDTIDELNAGVAGLFGASTYEVTDMRKAATSLYKDHIDKNLAGGASLSGAPTGFREFDSRSGGLQKGNFVVIAGETSQGKTSFATSVIMNAARAGYPVAYYSMEMTATELFARMAAVQSGIPPNRYLYGQLSPEELLLFDKSLTQLVDLPVYFDDQSTSNIDVIISSIRAMVIRKGIKGAVIDYLQILNVNMKGASKEQQMGEVSRRLKNLAKDLGIWIIALSQLRRDEHTHMPNLNRLRDSGQIAEAADTVILLYRPEVYGRDYPEPFIYTSPKGTAMVDIAKGRNIGLMKFIVGFEPSLTRFYELEEIPRVGKGEMEEEYPF